MTIPQMRETVRSWADMAPSAYKSMMSELLAVKTYHNDDFDCIFVLNAGVGPGASTSRRKCLIPKFNTAMQSATGWMRIFLN